MMTTTHQAPRWREPSSILLTFACMALLLACTPLLAWGKAAHNDLTSLLVPSVPNIIMVYIPGALALITIYVVIFLHPEFGLLLYLALLPFRSVTLYKLGGASIVMSDITVFPMVLGWMFNGTFRHDPPRSPFRRTGFEAPLIGFLFLCTLSLYWSIGYSGTLSKIIQLSYGLILFYSGVELIKTPRMVTWIIMFWSIGALINSGSSVFAYLVMGTRSGGWNINPLESATYMLFGLSLTMGFWIGLTNRWARFIVFLSLLVQLTGFIIANCRGPMLGLAAGFALPFFLDKEVRKLAAWGLGLTACIYFFFGILAISVPGSTIPNPFIRFFHPNVIVDIGEVYRQDIWHSILTHVVPAAPLLGVGAGSLYGLLGIWGHQILGAEHEAHSMYLEVLAALGPIGLTLMMWFWISYLHTLWHCYRDIRNHLMRGIVLGGICAVISKCVAGFTYGFYIEDRYQWTTLALVLGMAKVGLEMQGTRTKMSDPGPLVLAGGLEEIESPVPAFAPQGHVVPRHVNL